MYNWFRTGMTGSGIEVVMVDMVRVFHGPPRLSDDDKYSIFQNSAFGIMHKS